MSSVGNVASGFGGCLPMDDNTPYNYTESPVILVFSDTL